MLTVDDHADFQRSATALLEAQGFKVVGGAEGGPEAVRAVVLLRPDVVLLDVQLPGSDGFWVAKQLSAGPEPSAVVLVFSRDVTVCGRRLKRSSERGFISKKALAGGGRRALLG